MGSIQFTDFPVEIKELIYTQVVCMSQPMSGTIHADFCNSPKVITRGKGLLNCLPAICFTNKRERIIASRVFVRTVAFRIWSPRSYTHLRQFFDTLPDNVGYSSVTELRLCCSFAVNGPAWSWEHERPSLDVALMNSCPNLRTLTFALRLYVQRFENSDSSVNRLTESFQCLVDCKNIAKIQMKLSCSQNFRLKEAALPVFKSLARGLQEAMLTRSGKKVVVSMDWKFEERWVYSWKTWWDHEQLYHSLMEQRYVDSLDERDLGDLNTPVGEAVEVLKMTLDKLQNEE